MSISPQPEFAQIALITFDSLLSADSTNAHVDVLKQSPLSFPLQQSSAPINFIETSFPAFSTGYVSSLLQTDHQVEYPTPLDYLCSNPEWAEPEARRAYAVAAVEQGVAWQVRINRELRKMSQGDLAEAIGTQQSAISRMENPEYGKYSIPILLKVANAFDCALLVKFVPYSALAYESEFLSEEDQYAPGYTEEISGERSW
jgi:transcriptional regulator with XRE-family HTH domain